MSAISKPWSAWGFNLSVRLDPPINRKLARPPFKVVMYQLLLFQAIC